MQVIDELEEVFRTMFNDEAIVLTEETTAADIAEWDSLAHVNLMFAIEEAFGVQFAGNQFGEFKNIGALVRFLERTRQAAS